MTTAELLHEAAEAHHVAFAATDGEDPEWAAWYAPWLLEHGLDTALTADELHRTLVELDEEYSAKPRDERWEDFYARALV